MTLLLLFRRPLHLFLVLTTLLTISTLTIASSIARNPLSRITTAHDPEIHTPNHHVTARSSFKLSFKAFKRKIRLAVEPNDDILPYGAEVNYLNHDGVVIRTEPIDRLSHKVFRGEAYWQNLDGSYSHVGHARVTVHRDGRKPLFAGAFTVNGDHHHIQLGSNYLQTRHEMDPVLDDGLLKQVGGDESEVMVVFRDSDIMSYNPADSSHDELRRRRAADADVGFACRHDTMDFNVDPEHPIYTAQFTQNQQPWSFEMPGTHGLTKRQMDGVPGAGNSAGVNLASTVGSTDGCPNTRRVALVGVATDCTYTEQFNSSESVKSNIIDSINSASALYEKTFNISLGLQNLTISPKGCPGSPPPATPWNVPCSDGVDIQDRLNTFSEWRGKQVDTNSHWTLLTNCNSGSAVGLAWLGQACVIAADARNGSSGGVQQVSGANVVARTGSEWQVIAHETGHTFGAVHDCTDTSCRDGTATKQQCCPLSQDSCDAGQRYIMNPWTVQGVTNFSPCSVGNICSAMGRQSVKTTCFNNNRGVTVITGQQCGNGIVEQGEDCDCGGADSCGDNPCCDAKTCKFKAGAVCDDSNEECCRSCQLAAANTVCRPSTGECDPEEKCSGDSPICPEDETAPDGQSCGEKDDKLQCASGHCTSRDLQCKILMGSYTAGNDTHACDSNSCTLSCASPEFGPGMCYGLQQNFLDGTTCGGGGHCENGQCKGSNFAKEIKSWIDSHKPLVIGISCGVGVLILLMILSCIRRAFMRRRHARAGFTPFAAASAAARSGRSLRGRHNKNTSPVGSGVYPSMAQQQQPWPSPPSGYGRGMSGSEGPGNVYYPGGGGTGRSVRYA